MKTFEITMTLKVRPDASLMGVANCLTDAVAIKAARSGSDLVGSKDLKIDVRRIDDLAPTGGDGASSE